MSRARVVVLEIVSGHLSVSAAARTYGMSRQHIYRLLKRFREGGLEAVDPRSRRPASNPRAVSDEVITTIVLLREKLTAQGLDAGPITLQEHLAQQQLPVPSTSTIRRILHHHGLITPQPHKRPRSSYHRFAAEQPNECWQSDFTHWTLADGTDIEILNWLDDHSRYLLYCTAFTRVSGPDIVASFTTLIDIYGPPASTLTDNGSVYTSRFTHGHNDFERLIASLGITQKNGRPGHPQTQGKIERFHQTLKRWLAARPRPSTLADLQHLLDEFRIIYNTERTHRALPAATTPAQAYTGRPKATPDVMIEHFRIRHDTVDQFGKLTLRHGSRLHHLGIGRRHAHTPVLIVVTTTNVTVISKTGHHLIADHRINPDRNYWPNQQKTPAKRPGNSVTDDSTHV
ncbi:MULTISPECIES: IS481 family transposase [Mycobacterium]|uniref:IS481 family transposase n=1 Tax=Mycobacterium syngnathidarum TaxID=1908205 RepID=A0A1S1JYU5_9MYCO|nr:MULTISPECIES: IS481 family transposase [Mycobacterium]MCG7608590.1 IS481 family transposase [Mycobacterium sp. CnD-18-1]OHT93550.1 IS481 family transposase [Mycobacterium syngnathidarum]